MACGSSVLDILLFIYTDGSDTPANSVFIPAGPALESGTLENARIAMEIISGSGSTSITRAVRGSEDRQSWDTPVEFGSEGEETTGGWHYQNGFVATPSAKRYLQFGVLVKNTGSNSDLNKGLTRLLIDMRC